MRLAPRPAFWATFAARAALAFALSLLPRLAAACPMCAGQQPGGTARIVALGLMILLPFSIAVIVFRALRRSGGLNP
jgi:hypothetical protein